MIVLIMAGGLGKRMNSDIPKVLHKVNNKPMIIHVIEKAIELNPDKIYIIVGKYKTIIEETICNYNLSTTVNYINQEIPNGTGHAILVSLPFIEFHNSVIILSGDVPLISIDTLNNLIKYENSLLITKLDNPHGCGRIIFKNNEESTIIDKIIEEKDCSNEEKLIKYVNCGIYHIQSNILKSLIPQITNNNKSNEYYLTDIVELMNNNDIKLNSFELSKNKQFETTNINTQNDLLLVNSLFENSLFKN